MNKPFVAGASVEALRNTLTQAFAQRDDAFEQRLAELLDGRQRSHAELIAQALRQIDQLVEQTSGRDTLTGLPTRALFCEHLQKAIERVKRYDGYMFAVLILGFDRFKYINNSLGFEIGDRMMLSIANRLLNVTRAVDTAARLEGDEFVLLIEQIDGIQNATLTADRLIELFNKPHDIDGQEVTSTVSIGIVTSDEDHSSPDEVLRKADTALHRAKANGKARHAIFEDRMYLEVRHTFDMERELRRAMDRDEMRLVYQPILDLESGTTNGFEALLRWQHPEMGNIPPDKFIPLAEEIGLIVGIGRWVIFEACRQLQKWQRLFPGYSSLTMNVNLSKRQMMDAGILGTIQQAVEMSAIQPELLKIEITESLIMDHPEHIMSLLNEMRGLGVRLCLDDFGTGYSSLSCLHRFPIDVLKVDRTFIQNMEHHIEFAAVIQAIVTLAHTLGMAVVAEGIETPDQLAQLQTLDCDLAQGYYFARPMEAADAEAYLFNGGGQMQKSA